ncbi:MAG: alginate lyase family protein [Desulfobacter sp.]|nr:MAG: alginate lyase family protein [Desulfobacter sp.]
MGRERILAKKLFNSLCTIKDLGLWSILNLLGYRLGCSLGLYKRFGPLKEIPTGIKFFFEAKSGVLKDFDHGEWEERIIQRSNQILNGQLDYYSRWPVKAGNPPDWLHDPFSGNDQNAEVHWSKIDEFKDGDIKNIWECSRFQWMLPLAQAYRLTGNPVYVETINAWLVDWVDKNPINMGPNWKCGQETAIRTLTLLLTGKLLSSDNKFVPGLVCLIECHCDRILMTIRYALSQNNNHATSEAAALFVGGAWLLSFSKDEALMEKASRWMGKGRRLLERLVPKLVAQDGSFSQHSLNYHRLLLSTLSLVECFRLWFNMPPFSSLYRSRCKAAANWLSRFVDDVTGDAPNIGPNDGAFLYDLFGCVYRDYRPTVAVASILFNRRNKYPLLQGMRFVQTCLNLPEYQISDYSDQEDCILNGGGYVLLNSGRTKAFIRYAQFKFRPSHADCLHLDIWHNGVNVLRDGGTYSYNTDSDLYRYFSGTASHNTVQFDDRDQMPRIGHFLFGNWLRMRNISDLIINDDSKQWIGSYQDYKGCFHRRAVEVYRQRLRVVDDIEGFERNATLRWRMLPGKWNLDGNRCEGNGMRFCITSNRAPIEISIEKGWESRHYLEKEELRVLTVKVCKNVSRIITDIEFME